MLLIVCFLLMIRVACCTDDLKVEIKSVDAHQHVNLTCPHKEYTDNEKQYWIRIISGQQPEFLGGTTFYDYTIANQNRHFTTKNEPKAFILQINRAQMIDTGLYYCIEINWTGLTFLRGIFLKVKGLQSAISDISQAPPSESVHPGEVSLQCSVLSDSEKKTCPEHFRVFWFRAGSHQSHPHFIYSDGGDAECGNASQKCFYNFSKKVNVSDAATYYCAVAACGELMFGNGTKLDIKDPNTRHLNNTEIALCIFCVALAASVTFSVYLIWTNKKKDCNCGATPASSDQQRDEASLTYSAPTFNRRKGAKAGRGNTHSAQKETLYTDVRFHH